MAKILSPNKKYNGVSASIRFCDGAAETDEKHLIKWFKEHGYEVIEEEKTSVMEEPIPEEPCEEQEKKETKTKKKATEKSQE